MYRLLWYFPFLLVAIFLRSRREGQSLSGCVIFVVELSPGSQIAYIIYISNLGGFAFAQAILQQFVSASFIPWNQSTVQTTVLRNAKNARVSGNNGLALFLGALKPPSAFRILSERAFPGARSVPV